MKSLLTSLVATSVFISTVAAAASIRNVEISASNTSPYVGEDFSLVIKIETSPGCEINNISLLEMPPTNYLARGQLEILPVKSAGEGVFLHTVQTRVRPLKKFTARIQPVIAVDIVSRGGSGFFTTMFSEQRQFRPNGIGLDVKPLPEEGRPENFRDAIGAFTIFSSVTPEEIAVGDIVKLNITVKGSGHISPDAPILPDFDKSLFKTYSPKSEIGKDGTISIVQTIVPLSTQAVDIASVKLPYFDSTTHSYRIAETAPLKLVFHEKEMVSEPEVREVIVSANTTATPVPALISGGLFSSGEKMTVDTDTELHLAPSEASKTLCVIPAQTTVYAIEKYGVWTRVRSQKKCGWIKK